LSLRQAAVLVRASNLAFVLLLVACVEHQSLPNDPAGRLFARGLDEITDLYIAPVSSRKLILAGASRFSRLDDKFSVTESPAAESKMQVVLSYGGREVAVYPIPALLTASRVTLRPKSLVINAPFATALAGSA